MSISKWYTYPFSDCDNVVLPRVADDIKGREQEFCPRCECKYESRNSNTIKVITLLLIENLSVMEYLFYGIQILFICSPVLLLKVLLGTRPPVTYGY